MGKTSSAVKERWNEKAYDRIVLRVPKGQKELLQQTADRAGESINTYVNQAILHRMGLTAWPQKSNEVEEEENMERWIYPCLPLRAAAFPAADDPIWERAESMRLSATETGDAPNLPTEARAFYDPEARMLYFRFIGQDDEAHSDYKRRDEPIYNQDVLEVFLCDGDDLHRYKEFEVSPFNVQFDADITYHAPHQTTIGLSWDLAGWQSETHYDAAGRRLTSVWAMPLTGFDHVPAPGERWRMNVYRIDHSARGMELMAWSPTGEPNFHVPDRFGWIEFKKE